MGLRSQQQVYGLLITGYEAVKGYSGLQSHRQKQRQPLTENTAQLGEKVVKEPDTLNGTRINQELNISTNTVSLTDLFSF